jgi:hypothetical protein
LNGQGTIKITFMILKKLSNNMKLYKHTSGDDSYHTKGLVYLAFKSYNNDSWYVMSDNYSILTLSVFIDTCFKEVQ